MYVSVICYKGTSHNFYFSNVKETFQYCFSMMPFEDFKNSSFCLQDISVEIRGTHTNIHVYVY